MWSDWVARPNSPAFSPHPAEAGGVGRGAAAELQVVTLKEFLEVYDGYIGGKYLRGWRVFESLGYFACGPVGLVHTKIFDFFKRKSPPCKRCQVAGHLAETSEHLVRKRRFLRQDPLVMELSGGSGDLLKKATAPCRPSRCLPVMYAPFL